MSRDLFGAEPSLSKAMEWHGIISKIQENFPDKQFAVSVRRQDGTEVFLDQNGRQTSFPVWR